MDNLSDDVLKLFGNKVLKDYFSKLPVELTEQEQDKLRSAGLVLGKSFQFSHDEFVTQMIEIGSRFDLKAAASAFIAANFDGEVSLAWQAVLPSLAITKTLVPHEAHILRPQDREQICWICGHSLLPEELAFHKYYANIQGSGFGENHRPDALYTLQVAEKNQHWPQASQAARSQFKNLLQWIETLPENFTYAKTRDTLHKTRVLKRSQKYRCETFLEALGLIGVLSTPDYPGILAKETSFAELDRRPNKNVETTGPIGHWRVRHGVNWGLVKDLFLIDK
ncbi:hypothetical protein [Bartonella sp. HY038]|uniref:hypothetical protein n=1 Tax=Bartonella sp. HY038 TaxID=2759660 RepID=UPI0015FCD14C|nr:hypothetical protein [Bartonella sp. HY038]